MDIDAPRALEAAGRIAPTTLLILVLAAVIWLLTDRVISREDTIIDRLGTLSSQIDQQTLLLDTLVHEIRDAADALVWRVASTCPPPAEEP